MRRMMFVCLVLLSPLCMSSASVHATASNACDTVAPFPDSATYRYFPETRHVLGNGFKAYWDAHGGVAIFGFPITEEFTQRSQIDGKEHTVQYFERERFEYHSEFKGTPYEIELGLLGSETTAGRHDQPFQPTAKRDYAHGIPTYYFPQTQHNAFYTFEDFATMHGGLSIFGYPISEMFTENGVQVQYFERARFEFHLDVPGGILFGLLGNDVSPCRGS